MNDGRKWEESDGEGEINGKGGGVKGWNKKRRKRMSTSIYEVNRENKVRNHN